jgi:1-deoxy-D-xylulose 5-phosphate reductoisomerase
MIYITQCAEDIIIHNIIQICTLFDLYIINVQKNLQTVLLANKRALAKSATVLVAAVNTSGDCFRPMGRTREGPIQGSSQG